MGNASTQLPSLFRKTRFKVISYATIEGIVKNRSQRDISKYAWSIFVFPISVKVLLTSYFAESISLKFGFVPDEFIVSWKEFVKIGDVFSKGTVRPKYEKLLIRIK